MQWESDILSLPLEQVDMVLQGREAFSMYLLQGLCFDPTAPRLAFPFLFQGRGDSTDVVLVFFVFPAGLRVCVLAQTLSDITSQAADESAPCPSVCTKT